MTADFIYLASQSPRRRQLLDQLGVRHELLVPQAGAEADAAEALDAARAQEVVGYLGVWLPCFCLSLIFAAGVSPKAGSPFSRV